MKLHTLILLIGIPVLVWGQPHLVVEPVEMDFGNVPIGDDLPSTLLLSLSNSGTSDLVITSLEIADSNRFSVYFNESNVISPNESIEIVISFRPFLEQEYRDTIIIQSNDPDSITIVPISGIGFRVHLTLTPPSLDFGDVLIGQQRTLNMTLHNQGAVDIFITAIYFWPPEMTVFSETGDHQTIPAGGQITISTTFIPSEERIYDATININHNIPPTFALVGHVYGVGRSLSADNSAGLIPQKFTLYQNYPNPFNPTTEIQFDLPKSGQTTLKVFDISGREVASLVNEIITAGTHEIEFDASNLSSGIYIYQMQSGNYTVNKKMVLMK